MSEDLCRSGKKRRGNSNDLHIRPSRKESRDDDVERPVSVSLLDVYRGWNRDSSIGHAELNRFVRVYGCRHHNEAGKMSIRFRRYAWEEIEWMAVCVDALICQDAGELSPEVR